MEVVSETGHVKNQIEAQVQGEPQDIRLNLQYLREAIEGCSILGYDSIYLAATGTEKPILVTPTKERRQRQAYGEVCYYAGDEQLGADFRTKKSFRSASVGRDRRLQAGIKSILRICDLSFR